MATPNVQGLSLAKLGVPARIGVGLLLTALIGASYYLVFYTDIDSKVDATKRQAVQLTADLATAKQAQASYFADRDELVARQQRQREFNKVLPAETEQAAFLSSVQQVSNVSGIDLKGWQPLDERVETFFARVPMHLDMTGKFHQVAKFAYEMSKLDRIINVENIQLSSPRLDGDDVILTAKCLATTFHMLPSKDAKK